jgi:hypothetical protein
MLPRIQNPRVTDPILDQAIVPDPCIIFKMITGARNCGGPRATSQREIQTRTSDQEAAAAARTLSDSPPDFHGSLHEKPTCTSRKSLCRKKVVVVLGLPYEINQLLEFFPTLKLM